MTDPWEEGYNFPYMNYTYFLWVKCRETYCWWLKSCTTWDVWNPINNGINYLSTGAGFQPSTVPVPWDYLGYSYTLVSHGSSGAMWWRNLWILESWKPVEINPWVSFRRKLPELTNKCRLLYMGSYFGLAQCYETLQGCTNYCKNYDYIIILKAFQYFPATIGGKFGYFRPFNCNKHVAKFSWRLHPVGDFPTTTWTMEIHEISCRQTCRYPGYVTVGPVKIHATGSLSRQKSR